MQCLKDICIVRKNVINQLISRTKNATYVTGDARELEQYQQDPFTDFTYTNNAYEEVFGLIKKVSTIQNIKKIPEYLSVLIISGAKDPFGKFGVGPKWLYEALSHQGVKDITLSLYDRSHHDLLHDQQRLEVYKDVLDWLNQRTFV